MSNDPFAEDVHPNGTPSLTSPHKNHPRSQSSNQFPAFAQSPSAVHNPAASPNSSHLSAPYLQHHDRTVSEDIDDHMCGSLFQPTDICPACQRPRMFTVQCPVTQLHHGTDLPCDTPRKRQKGGSGGGFFSKLRESFQSHNNHSETPVNPTDSQPTSAVHREVPRHPSGGALKDDDSSISHTSTSSSPEDPSTPTTAAALEATTDATPTAHPRTPSNTGISLFGIKLSRTKDEKQIVELEAQEEHDRKKMLHDFMHLDMEEMGRQATEIHKQVRHALKHQVKARQQLETEFKESFDRMYLERKAGLEEIRREHLTDAKLMHKKERERRKHGSSASFSVEAAGGDSNAVSAISVSSE